MSLRHCKYRDFFKNGENFANDRFTVTILNTVRSLKGQYNTEIVRTYENFVEESELLEEAVLYFYKTILEK